MLHDTAYSSLLFLSTMGNSRSSETATESQGCIYTLTWIFHTLCCSFIVHLSHVPQLLPRTHC